MELQEYYSSDDFKSDEETLGKQRNPNRRRKWKRDRLLTNEQEIDNVINKENFWSFHYSNISAEGRKLYYRCNKVKLRGKQCDAGIFLLYDAASNDVILFRCTSEHTHEEIKSHKPKISFDVQQEIQRLFNLKLKPKGILEALNEKQFPVPTMVQLRNFLTKIKKEKYGGTTISLGELEQWCLESCQNKLNLDMDAPFVVSYEVDYNEDLDDEKDINDNGTKFRFFISTRRLLNIASHARNIHADATYKLVWQGFPILIIGTTDLDRHFHPFGLAVCTNEEKQDFKFVFQTLINGLEMINKETTKIEVLIADSANAIRNAFQEIFGEKQMIMCWAHVHRNVTKKVLFVRALFIYLFI